MPLARNAESRLLDDACAVIEDMGGVDRLIDDLDEFHKLRVRMIREHSRLIEKYPGKWVAMGKDGVGAVGESKRDVFDEIETRGIRRSAAVGDLMPSSIPDAWPEEKANALAIATALSNMRGVDLPWSSVQTAIESAIQTRWLELSKESAEWPTDLAGAQHVVLQAPTTDSIRDPDGKPNEQLRLGMLVAEAPLEANGIQDLADQIPGITQAAVGSELKFNVRIELGGDTAPDPEVVEKINHYCPRFRMT